MGTQGTVLLAGGGTGGHLYPGISVARELARLAPDLKPLFLVTQKEIDKVILDPTGFEYMAQPITPVIKTLSGLMAFWRGWRVTHKLVTRVLNTRNVVAAIGLGGYAAGVGIKLAAQKKIPTAILNPDAIPGKANQYLMKWSQAVFCQYEESRAHVSPQHHSKLKITGCPIRPDIGKLPQPAEAANRLGLDPDRKTLVVTGASLGAKTVNEAMLEAVVGLKLEGWQILHLAGREHANAVSSGYTQKGIHARVIDFTENMNDVWAVADLALSRSGAGSCAELTACGVPSILMPYPYHKDMHQRANAKVLEKAGAAIILDDEKDARKNSAKLKPLLESLLFDSDKRLAMAKAAKSLSHSDAAEQVAKTLLALAGR